MQVELAQADPVLCISNTNNNLQAFQLIVLARYLLCVP